MTIDEALARARSRRRRGCSRSAAGCKIAAQTTGTRPPACCRGEGFLPPDAARSREPRYLFVAPALGLIAVFFLVPGGGIVSSLSLTDFDLYALADRANAALRRRRATTPRCCAIRSSGWRCATRCTSFVVAGPLSVALSLARGAAGHQRRRCAGRGVFRTLFFLPVVTSLVAVAVVVALPLPPALRPAELRPRRSIGIGPLDWLGDPRLAMPAIILMSAWKNFGFNMVIFMAGLQSIPERLYEAASIDGDERRSSSGASPCRCWRPPSCSSASMTLIGNFQLFAEPYVMTQGGPSHSTLSLVLYMYEEGFRWWSLGYAAALAFVLLALILSATALTRLRDSPRRCGGAGGFPPRLRASAVSSSELCRAAHIRCSSTPRWSAVRC